MRHTETTERILAHAHKQENTFPLAIARPGMLDHTRRESCGDGHALAKPIPYPIHPKPNSKPAGLHRHR